MSYIFIKKEEFLKSSSITLAVTLLIYIVLICTLNYSYYKILTELISVLILLELMIISYFYRISIYTKKKYRLAKKIIQEIDMTDFMDHFNKCSIDSEIDGDSNDLNKYNRDINGVKFICEKYNGLVPYRVFSEEHSLLFLVEYQLPWRMNKMKITHIGFQSKKYLILYKCYKKIAIFCNSFKFLRLG